MYVKKYDQSLVYLDGRLGSRLKYADFNKQIMGPIADLRGLEQCGVYSFNAYKIYNNKQASSSHCSNLGVKVLTDFISCISLADYSVMHWNDLWGLKNPLYLKNHLLQI